MSWRTVSPCATIFENKSPDEVEAGAGAEVEAALAVAVAALAVAVAALVVVVAALVVAAGWGER